MVSKPKTWRISMVIEYNNDSIIKLYRETITSLLTQFATLYKLDYSTTIDHQFEIEGDSSDQAADKSSFDLFYFRSNEYTRLEKKDFRKLTDLAFGRVPSTLREGVEIYSLLYKHHDKYPFPLEFYRPLNFPWIERHKGDEKQIFLPSNPVMELIENQQDHSLN